MKKLRYIVAPDSYKGTLSAREVADAIKAGILDADPNAEIIALPIADGGEGTVDAVGAARIPCAVTGPDGGKTDSFWGLMPDGGAVIEMAAAAGLPLTKLRDPEKATTFGVGELILNALDRGCRRFTVGLGGSATNDAGCGMAAALGAVFTDAEGKLFVPVGGTLEKIGGISLDKLDRHIAECTFTTMCDITNPLYGKNGAAYVFAPQKGADGAMVERLDAGLRHFAAVAARDTGYSPDGLEGGGAAGGMGAGMRVFLKSELVSGIKAVLDLADFDGLVDENTLVITGEGKFDSQSLGGKAVSGVASRAKKHNAPVVVIAGSADIVPDAYKYGVTAVFSIQRAPLPFDEAMRRNAVDLSEAAFNIARLWGAMNLGRGTRFLEKAAGELLNE